MPGGAETGGWLGLLGSQARLAQMSQKIRWTVPETRTQSVSDLHFHVHLSLSLPLPPIPSMLILS